MSAISGALDVIGLGALNIDYVATRSALSAIDSNLLGELRERFEHGTESPATRDEVESILHDTRSIPFETCLGGSAFNVILALAHMNPSFRLGFIGVAGAPRQRPSPEPSFEAWFARHRVDNRYVERSAEPPGTCISYINEGERSLRTYPGANAGIGELLREKRDAIVDYVSTARVVHVTSLFDDTSPPLLAEVLQQAKKRNPWLIVSFDPGYHWTFTRPAGFAEILRVADYVFLNAREFQHLGSHRVGDKDDDLAKRIFGSCGPRALAVVLKRYDCISVFARLDRRVVEMRYGNTVLEPEQIEDATGTGDIFAAGLLASRILPWLELRHGVTLGLRLVHQKLRVGGNRNAPIYGRVFDGMIDEVSLEHGRGPIDERGHAARVERTDERPSAKPASRVTYCHSPDFRSFRVGDEHYAFTPTQACVAQQLLDAWKHGVPDVGQSMLLLRADSEAKRLHDLFRDSEAWQALIVPGKTRGTWRLALPPDARFEETAAHG